MQKRYISLALVIAVAWAAGPVVAQICPTPSVFTYPHQENFDSFGAVNGQTSPPLNWVQDQTDGGGTGGATDWFFRNQAGPNGTAGPPSDQSTGAPGSGFYMHVDSAAGSHPAINMVSQCLDFTLTPSPSLSFWVYSNNDTANPTATQNFLHVDVIVHPQNQLVPDVTPPIGHIGPHWELVTVDLSPVAATLIQVVLRAETASSNTHDIAVDTFTISNAPAYDFGVVSVDAPNDAVCGTLSSAETVTVTIRNFGQVPLPAGSVARAGYSLDGGSLVAETAPAPATVPPGGTYQYTFSQTADLSSGGTHSIMAQTTHSDANGGNDAATRMIFAGTPSPVASYPYLETLDTYGATNGGTQPPPCWLQDTADGGGTGGNTDWIFGNAQAPSGNGPTADHSTGTPGSGFFAYVEDSGSSHAAVSMTTDIFDLSMLINPTLRFYVHSNNGAAVPTTNENFLSIDVIDIFTGGTTPDVVTIGHLGNSWVQQSVDLSAFAGGQIFVRFRASSNGGGNLHNIAIDDVEMLDAPLPPGQAPQAGLAVFDINNSMTLGGMPVSPSTPGPYFTTATVGSPFTFSFQGQGNRAIIVLVGPRNVGAAMFPGVGQLDIGGPPDPVTGFPTGISILADGNNPSGFNIFFRTGPTGSQTITFGTPALPLGVIGTFQCLFANSLTVVALSNAIEVTII